MKNFALAGNPNCGKTTLFNSLTGSTAYVGNWPGVTVDKKTGVYKNRTEKVNIIDLPGIYSLSPYTPEEVISRNYILDEKPDCIINIVDATNLERNLYLTTQLLEIDVPIIIALNMMDVVNKNGDRIDAKLLEKEIGVSVVEISALKEDNLDDLMSRAIEASNHKREGTTFLSHSILSHLIGDVEIAYKTAKVESPLFHAIKMVENDEIETKMHPNLVETVTSFKATLKDEVFGNDLEAIVADQRYKYISSYFSKVYIKKVAKEEKKERSKFSNWIRKIFHIKEKENDSNIQFTKSDKIDRILTNKWVGIPIFLLILLVIFHLVFSTNFLFLKNLISGTPSFEGTIMEGLFWTEDGLNSIGVILQTLVINLTDALTGVIEGALSGAEPWVSGLICGGVLKGLFAVISFVPQILLLFLFFSILEDSGYMARVAFILDRIFRKFGLSGRAFMPMIMGFGCSVPAMINTRTLASDNERTATIRVIPFFSCGAKLPILTGIAGAIATMAHIGYADLITFSMYLLGMLVAIGAVLLMRNTTMRGAVPPFIMELPAYHMPQFRALMIHLWDKLKHFLKKAFTIILASTIVIWFVMHFSWNWTYLDDSMINDSILVGLGQLFQPLFTPLGFGSQLNIVHEVSGISYTFGWVFVVAAVTGLIAKEDVIGTFEILAACIVGVLGSGIVPIDIIENGEIATMIWATGISVPGLLAFIAYNMLTIPCFAACATAKAELPKGKFGWTLLFWVGTSYLVSSAFYVIGTWWWTSFIYLAVLALTIALIVIHNKRHPIISEA